MNSIFSKSRPANAILLLMLVAILAACTPIQAPTPVPESAPSNSIEATFVCPDGTILDTVFDNDAGTVSVALPDETVTLPRAESASGARYSDGTTTFWNKGDEAMVEINGEIVYQNCVVE